MSSLFACVQTSGVVIGRESERRWREPLSAESVLEALVFRYFKKKSLEPELIQKEKNKQTLGMERRLEGEDEA